MDWKNWILLIILGIVLVASFWTCFALINKKYEEKKGIEIPKVFQKEVYIRAIDDTTNEQLAVNLQIFHNGTYKEVTTNRFNWEVTNLFSDNQVTAYGENIMLEKSACDTENTTCLIKVKTKGVFVPQLGKDSQDYPILLPFRISCVNGTCNKAKICWDWGKKRLSAPLEIRDVTLIQEKNMIQEHCFEDSFEKGVIDFTLAVEYFNLTDNDFIEVEAFDWAYYKQEEALLEAYDYEGEDLGYKNLEFMVYPSEKRILYK